MKQLLIDIKNISHFISYGIKFGVINILIFCINLIIFIYAISQWKYIVQETNILTLIFLVFVNIIWQLISLSKDFYDYFKKSQNYIVPNKNIRSFKLSDELCEKYVKKELPGKNAVIYSDAVNKILANGKRISVIVSTRKEKRVNHYIKTYFNILLPFLQIQWYDAKNRNGAFYNEKKLCMASEIEESINGEYVVTVNAGNYYNSFLTNNIYSLKLSGQNGVDIIPPLNIENSPIKSLNNSCLSNHIGVSTIAVTLDGYAVIMRHNNKSIISTNKLMPTASGSVDYADLIKDDDFRSTIIKAAEREFCEETKLKSELIGDTKIIGFYRDLSRGGKPEFCCISTLMASKPDVNELVIPDSLEQRDDFEMVRIYENQAFSHAAVEKFLTAKDNEISLALYMNFEFLPLYF